jgi:hypothetical protein
VVVVAISNCRSMGWSGVGWKGNMTDGAVLETYTLRVWILNARY